MIPALVSHVLPLDVPNGDFWNQDRDVDMVHTVLLLGGVPLLLFIGIALAVYVPSLVRGEAIAPGAPAVENQWLGGPRSTAELTGPDAEADDTGGASGRW